MEKLRILTLIGGISRNSLNKNLFKAIKELAPPDFDFYSFDIRKLPNFSEDLEIGPPESVTKFKDLIRESDAVLIITPQYNRAFPRVLKNALDWGSRPYSQNLWDKKPGGVMGVTLSRIRTFGAQQQLRQVLTYLNVSVMGQPEFYFISKNSFNDDGKLVDDESIGHVRQYLEAFKDWIERVGERKHISPPLTHPPKGLEDSQFTH